MNVAVLPLLISALATPLDEPQATPTPPEPIHFTIRGRWADPGSLRYRVVTDNCPVSVPLFVRSMERALASWASTGVVGFRPVGPEETADFTIEWKSRSKGTGAPFRHGRLARAGRVEPGTYIHFNHDRTWSEDGVSAPGLYQTALHEVGHILGLDHSSNSRSSLFSRYDGSNDALSPSELAALHSLYGGGADGPGDLTPVRFDQNGRGTIVATPLRRIAPASEREYEVQDLDGDGRDEIFTWPKKRDLERGFLIYELDPQLRLVRTVGPFPLVVDPVHEVRFGRDPEGRTVLVHAAPNGRYRASRFRSGKRLPLELVPPRTPLVLDGETLDADGDGYLDPTPPPVSPPRDDWRLEATRDLDGDGKHEQLRSRSFKAQAADESSSVREFGWFRGERRLSHFRSSAVIAGDLDGDGRDEWIARDYRAVPNTER